MASVSLSCHTQCVFPPRLAQNMTTHASENKQWTDRDLDSLLVENDFRLRGVEVTRLDTFVDAAFAFVLTLLVISFDSIPSNYPEMIVAASRIPGFAASFAVLMMFWLQHRLWSRCYGLENSKTVLYSLVMIFVMLVYVYPLRMIFEGMFANLTGGFLPTSYEITSYYELRMIFVFYSVGYCALSVIISQLYRAALLNCAALGLNQIELRKTRISVQAWTISAIFGVLSIVFALTLPNAWVVAAGYMYFGVLPAMRVPAYLDRRRYPDT